MELVQSTKIKLSEVVNRSDLLKNRALHSWLNYAYTCILMFIYIYVPRFKLLKSFFEVKTHMHHYNEQNQETRGCFFKII